MGIEHEDAVAANIHVVGYVQDADPGAIGAGKVWIDTTLGTGLWVTKVRNAADTGWEAVSGASSDQILIEGDTLANYSVVASDTKYYPYTITLADVDDGDDVEIKFDVTCYFDDPTNNSYVKLEVDISLDDGGTWTTLGKSWIQQSQRRNAMAITSFISGTVDTAAKIRLEFEQQIHTTGTFSAIYYSVITKVTE